MDRFFPPAKPIGKVLLGLSEAELDLSGSAQKRIALQPIRVGLKFNLGVVNVHEKSSTFDFTEQQSPACQESCDSSINVSNVLFFLLGMAPDKND